MTPGRSRRVKGAKLTRADNVLRCFSGLQTWKRKGERAPHKPLLALLALGRLQNGEERLATFGSIEDHLSRLLRDFGPPRHSVNPQYPFWRLQRDGIWEVRSGAQLKRRMGSNDPLRTELRSQNVEGGFQESLFRTLNEHPEICRAVAQSLLDAHFPTSLHGAIAASVGLNLEDATRNLKRDPSFRREIISVWGHRCGFCGFDVKLDRTDLALDAAHIKWVRAGGPESLTNGICCCAIHHQALDAGAIGVDDDLRILVSSEIHGGPSLASHFGVLQGNTLYLPSRTAGYPNHGYLTWHRNQVFKGAPRD